MKQFYGLLNWGLAFSAVLLVVSACSPDLSESSVNKSTNEANCTPGLPCDGGGFCYVDNDSDNGRLNCVEESPDNSCPGDAGSCWSEPGCVEGGYCDSEDDDCIAVDETALFCNVGDNVLHEQDCGDGMMDGAEVCDDGNELSCDGCRADCSAREEGCGDGFTCGSEACDDGNDENGDSCDDNCTVPDCGNRVIDMGEDCDDGNGVSGDGCDNNCTRTSCGNGIMTAGEVCDDDDTVECGGGSCTADCQQAVTGCGDGVICGTEVCDDMNDNDLDDCSNECVAAICGDGVMQAGEDCDDANDETGDSCNDCVAAMCGDGITQPLGADGVLSGGDDEACDSGNTSEDNIAGCDSDCTLTDCGDDDVAPGIEGCDDGNEDNDDACTNMCIPAFCGDGYVQEGVEDCDDGNSSNGDLCNIECEDQDCDADEADTCEIGIYGCYGTLPSVQNHCMMGMTQLDCSCPNPLDSNRGTWLMPGADCETVDLCWSPVDPDTDDDDDGGVSGAGGAAGTVSTGGSGGAAGMMASCEVDEKMCIVCVDQDDPAYGCGVSSCAPACSLANAVDVCTANTCAIGTCDAGYVNCNSMTGDGCEVHVTDDEANCGACGSVCDPTNAAGLCLASACTIGTCDAGYTNCNGLAGDGCEVHVTDDEANCGACGNACAMGSTCTASVCVPPSGGDGVSHFTFTSMEVVTGTAEVRVKPAWIQVHTFAAFPTTFTLTPAQFVFGTNTMTVQWPLTSASNWFCEVMTLQGGATAIGSTGILYVGTAVSNGFGGCDVGWSVAP